MIGVMALTFVLFFAFVINTGMLVNAKINLQNAADLAAYAGAATQARQLNTISYLNYEMRRQYKKFLFRYYVLGNMAQQTNPLTPGGPTQARQWGPDLNTQFGVPVVCIIFSARDNYCQVRDLKKIEVAPPAFGDPINQILNIQLKELEKLRQRNCSSIAQTNIQILMFWLYNTDPDLSSLTSSTSSLSAAQANILAVIRGITQGLGLIPKNLLLRRRISSVTNFINEKPYRGLSKTQADTLARTGNPAYERPLQAFLSAYYTLGNHAFPAESITMDELLPPGSSGSNLLALEDIKESFDAYAQFYELRAGGTLGTSSDCLVKLAPIRARAVPLGVAKDPKIMTYYAVRMSAKAKILFSPFGDLDLKAYAAAQPFGSRIGPPKSELQGLLTYDGQPNIQDNFLPDGFNAADLFRKVPNLPVSTDEAQLSRGKGWDNNFVIGTFFQSLQTAGADRVIQMSELERSYQTAMVPNPWEGTRFNIMNEIGPDMFMKYFDTNQVAAILAPVYTAETQNEVRQSLKDEIDALFRPDQVPGRPILPDPDPTATLRLKEAIQNELIRYLGAVEQGRGENGEGIRFVRLANPFVYGQDPYTATGASLLGQPINLDPALMMREAPAFKTSWNRVPDQRARSMGRVGYSVKFVSFDSLLKRKQSPNGGRDLWTNELPQDAESQADLENIKH